MMNLVRTRETRTIVAETVLPPALSRGRGGFVTRPYVARRRSVTTG